MRKALQIALIVAVALIALHGVERRVGQVIMLGSLLAVIVVIVGSVLRFDPEARGDRDEGGEG